MNSKSTLKFILFLSILFSFNSTAQIKDLKEWIHTPDNERSSIEELPFSTKNLSKKEANEAIQFLARDKQNVMLKNYEDQWKARELKFEKFKMPFYYQTFGEQPPTGRSLIISLHGGGGAPASVNDQQYKNQQHLYDATMKNLEGIYLAARAPTDSWDLWHQSHIDNFLNIIIQMAVIKENVNPNKVYIIGYSAGGDGLYQLAPRMADRWAATSMMAGHPGDASAQNLRNTPFGIHVGSLDEAYNRNNLAKKWKTDLDKLEAENPGYYKHDVHTPNTGHWMKLKDAIALPWMQQFKRNPVPNKITWQQDDRYHSSFSWLQTPKKLIKKLGKIEAVYNTKSNEINILDNYSSIIQLSMNDTMLNLNKPVTIKYQGEKIYKGKLKRSILNIYNTLKDKGDINLAFPTVISVVNNQSIKE